MAANEHPAAEVPCSGRLRTRMSSRAEKTTPACAPGRDPRLLLATREEGPREAQDIAILSAPCCLSKRCLQNRRMPSFSHRMGCLWIPRGSRISRGQNVRPAEPPANSCPMF